MFLVFILGNIRRCGNVRDQAGSVHPHISILRTNAGVMCEADQGG